MRLARFTPSVSMKSRRFEGRGGKGGYAVVPGCSRRLPESPAAGDVAEAHAADLEIQGEYGMRYEKYWDLRAGKFFCLVEASSPEAANKVHR